MSRYAIFFDKDNSTYRLPVNPEELETSSVQAIEKYEVLKLGQIAIPTHMELKEYSFECELPRVSSHYVETSGNFKNADYYISLFTKWRESKEPVRFIASNGLGDDINTLVLIEELTSTEKAGEEGDKYVKFSLLEYRKFGKKSVAVQTQKKSVMTIQAVSPPATNPKSNGSYTVVSGDTLWAIAKRYYGDGSQYPRIYDANRDKIKNPNLIYPGQELVIPA
jgi:nucleoid-associated protein YgaU